MNVFNQLKIKSTFEKSKRRTDIMLHGKLNYIVTLLYLLLLHANSPAENSSPDLLLIHGHIITVDAKDSTVQAIAISRGVIVKLPAE
jgi:hypothetical protein